MFDNRFKAQAQNLLIKGAKPVGFAQPGLPPVLDVLVAADGAILDVGANIVAESAKRVEANGAFISPGWTDLHAHVWYGGTDISIRPEQGGAARGVTTIV